MICRRTAPFLATLFVEKTGSTTSIAVYIAVLGLVGLACAGMAGHRRLHGANDLSAVDTAYATMAVRDFSLAYSNKFLAQNSKTSTRGCPHLPDSPRLRTVYR
jgi:hypothetical protein